jgi:oxygen-dependent protoporphyrinogen oxidase
MSEEKKVIILGAGISGLAYAWALKQKHGDAVSVTILEKSPRVGGWIQSEERDGFHLEWGPRSCKTGGGEATLKLIQELQLENEVIPAEKNAHKRYLYVRGKLQCVPRSPLSMIGSSLTRPILSALWKERNVKSSQTSEDESIDSFFRRRFSDRVASTFVDAMVSGIYAGDTRYLSMKSCFPCIHKLEDSHGSVIRGLMKGSKKKNYSNPFIQKIMKHSIFSLKGGLQLIPDAIAEQLDAEILCNMTATAIFQEENGKCGVVVDGKLLLADHIVSTLPARSLAPLVHEASPESSKELSSIPHASVAVVNLGYNTSASKLKGFGYLIPREAKEKILGCVWNHSVFPEQQAPGKQCLTVMMGGMSNPHCCHYGVDAIEEIALDAVAKHMGIKKKPDLIATRIARQAIPQYHVGHEEKISQIKEQISRTLPSLTVLGSSFEGTGVNGCILKASEAAEKFSLVKEEELCLV